MRLEDGIHVHVLVTCWKHKAIFIQVRLTETGKPHINSKFEYNIQYLHCTCTLSKNILKKIFSSIQPWFIISFGKLHITSVMVVGYSESYTCTRRSSRASESEGQSKSTFNRNAPRADYLPIPSTS